MSAELWRDFPLPSDWQTEELRIVSMKSFNLCVSCNVSAFSGWEKSEFDLRLLRRNRGPTFFGANVKGKQVTGFLDGDEERQLCFQWKMIENLLPKLATIDFENAILNVKQTEWYRTAKTNLETKFKTIPISIYGEHEALRIMLIFSNVSLHVATFERDDLKRKCLLKNALSVVLPLVRTTRLFLE